MKTTDVTVGDLARSVIAVPPLARGPDLELDATQNQRLLRHLATGGVTTVLYGGNANLYNIDGRQYAQLLESLPKWADETTWIIPSIGPSFGQLIDHVDVASAVGYPTAMALPLAAPATQAGTARGLRRAAERFGRPLVLYLKWDGYLSVELVSQLVDDGVVCAIKFAVDRDDPTDDPLLQALTTRVDPAMVVSGIGERPAVAHVRTFGLTSFTSGSVCVAPKQSTALLLALKEGRFDEADALRACVLPLEAMRDEVHPIRVLHDAVTEADVADMGPILPLLSNLDPPDRRRVRVLARTLRASESHPRSS